MKRSHAGNFGSPLFVGTLILQALIAVSTLSTTLTAQTGPDLRPLPDVAVPQSVPRPESIDDAPPTLEELVRQVIIEVVPDEYVDDKNWGRTTSRFDGFKTDGLRISKRSKRVSHGLWQRYRARLLKPDQTLKLTILPLEKDSNATVDSKSRYSISLLARARCEATIVNWAYGVKGLNGTTLADTTVRINLIVSINPQASFSFSDPIPKFDLNPVIERVDLALKDIDVHKIGIFRGPGVELLGDGSRKAIEELLERQEKKIRTKLQKKLDEL